MSIINKNNNIWIHILLGNESRAYKHRDITNTKANFYTSVLIEAMQMQKQTQMVSMNEPYQKSNYCLKYLTDNGYKEYYRRRYY